MNDCKELLVALEHLCDSCVQEFPTCISQNIVFGIDRDPSTAYSAEADKVLECDGYCNKKQYNDVIAKARGEQCER